jgi:hypothetical protein
VAEVADAFGVTWPTAHGAFVEYADALLAGPNRGRPSTRHASRSTPINNSQQRPQNAFRVTRKG